MDREVYNLLYCCLARYPKTTNDKKTAQILYFMTRSEVNEADFSFYLLVVLKRYTIDLVSIFIETFHALFSSPLFND